MQCVFLTSNGRSYYRACCYRWSTRLEHPQSVFSSEPEITSSCLAVSPDESLYPAVRDEKEIQLCGASDDEEAARETLQAATFGGDPPE